MVLFMQRRLTLRLLFQLAGLSYDFALCSARYSLVSRTRCWILL